ncbi:Imm71 family immunity protein [Cupriavidus sp. WGlv3]|uniref:Imm71 family immunity protein n=1 Tax=Cupriavidus sp. WGlv3 TaxID=2919924 RepID=UPI00209071BE|nr:Imm71 family immunity protein [Cupriavidus sp. WGlv3]MCO4862517.1 Imm71 family immunity protein [Cupriavidus sp. WGlv3]
MLPTDHERRQIFHWIRQISSYTAWKRILDFYETWAEAAENCRHLASLSGKEESSSVAESDHIECLKGLAHCEDGVLRLRHGDKRIFKYDVNGEFAMAGRPHAYWGNYVVRIEWGEHPVIDDNNTPGWSQFRTALYALAQAWGECSDILESRWVDEAAPLSYGNWTRDYLQKMHFPTDLPEIPDPEENILVHTGRTIPCSGIWEPVDAPKTNSFTLFRKPQRPKGPFQITGCMNYLHGGSPAPQASQDTGDDIVQTAVTWRLLWRDTRYEDGSIPAEEQDYVFLRPDPAESTSNMTSSATEDPFLWSETGSPAPHSGRWLAEHDLLTSITVEAGEQLPMHQGRATRWLLAKV